MARLLFVFSDSFLIMQVSDCVFFWNSSFYELYRQILSAIMKIL